MGVEFEEKRGPEFIYTKKDIEEIVARAVEEHVKEKEMIKANVNQSARNICRMMGLSLSGFDFSGSNVNQGCSSRLSEIKKKKKFQRTKKLDKSEVGKVKKVESRRKRIKRNDTMVCGNFRAHRAKISQKKRRQWSAREKLMFLLETLKGTRPKRAPWSYTRFLVLILSHTKGLCQLQTTTNPTLPWLHMNLRNLIRSWTYILIADEIFLKADLLKIMFQR
ncbi:hypothetical protein RhiirA5_374549 [Rhizophagus irregularis]|uniref:Uncharacterized protein n=1 Tax=Rhizophagus irregularis TaxID=588596 RepID=A0A2N0PUT5_9GLOM|nr:hypothetical protein RhiirA5_374549 [Rhizophagus irregularis]